jgi:transposase InsO family protein
MSGLDKLWGNVRDAGIQCGRNRVFLARSNRNESIIKNIKDVRQDIFWYIECFYNRQRRHQALGNITPAEFLKRYYLSPKAAA